MEKVHDWIIEAMGTDGIVHCLISAFLTALLGIFIPAWCAAVIVLLIGLSKEVYDKWSCRGSAEVKDLICDFIGVVIGVL